MNLSILILVSELFCSFLNNQCEITNDRNRFKQADAIVFHLRDFVNQSSELIVNRQQSQRFIFTLWESPINTPDLRAYDQFFNWSMTYRFDSHIFASYYAANPYYLKSKSSLKTIISDYQLDQEKIALYKNINITKKWGTAAALISNVYITTKYFSLYSLNKTFAFYCLVWGRK